MFWRISWRK